MHGDLENCTFAGDPAPPGLPGDRTLQALAAAEPAKLFQLAETFSRDGRAAPSGREGHGRDERSRDEHGRALMKIAEALAGEQSREAAEQAARLAGELPHPAGAEARRRLLRRTAWLLVQRPGHAALRPLFEALPERLDDAVEFRACLLHEMALRWGLDGAPYSAYGERLRQLGHPLAWLPLASLRFEHEMRRASCWEGTMFASPSPAELRLRHPEIPPTPAGAAAGRAAREEHDAARAEAAGAPYADLCGWEARFYVLPRPLDVADWNAALLAELPADCLAHVGAGSMAAVHSTADDLAGDLFLAAFSGGLWGTAQYGAYSRLLSWRSLYALLGLGAQTSPYDAVRLAAEHRWLRFAVDRHAANDWSLRDMSDTAFAVLDPSRTRIALLAATDTD